MAESRMLPDEQPTSPKPLVPAPGLVLLGDPDAGACLDGVCQLPPVRSRD